MADFHINKVPTFSLLQDESCASMEEKVQKASAKIPVGVLIPALYRDLSSDAMRNIISVLADTGYVGKYTSLSIRRINRII
jgi:glucosyl-3-phosphoglycerate synthase